MARLIRSEAFGDVYARAYHSNRMTATETDDDAEFSRSLLLFLQLLYGIRLNICLRIDFLSGPIALSLTNSPAIVLRFVFGIQSNILPLNFCAQFYAQQYKKKYHFLCRAIFPPPQPHV